MNSNKIQFGAVKTQLICGFVLLLACSAPASSLKEVKRKAEQGDAVAQFQLGRNYSDQKDYRKALAWFHKAAAQGNACAQNRLGVMHERGEGVRQDLVEAYKWYTLAGMNIFGVANRQSLERRLSEDQIAQGQERAALFLAPMLGCTPLP